ncbi:MAG: phosphoribosylformylglycinamidine synthase subunit PurQ [Bacteroidetes bacterium]|nr:MAG: phosphoribosylformylglycinamidine synthase subunit PurQ [Bacteroidota bacterium]
MKFGVVVFPGSNCDDDMVHVLGSVMGQEVVKLWHKETSLDHFSTEDCIVLPGGFSYGDYLRAGAIARFSPIMQAVVEFAEAGGWVWGICNGFQILCEAGLLPGALLRNENQKFICKNVHLLPCTRNAAITRLLDPHKPLKIPIAHAEGRYYADPATLQSLQANDQILFRYCNERGEVTPEANPNGSLLNIAGICNERRNVFGMMPHPERAAEPELGNTDGRGLFESLLAEAAQPA